MQIVLLASGTRGDVQPMIALGVALRQAGHAVRMLAGSNFAPWIAAHGLAVTPTVDMERVMQSDLGQAWAAAPSQLAQLRLMRALVQELQEQTIRDILAATQGADLVVGSFLTEPYGQALHERHGVSYVTAALQPYRATATGAASLVPLVPHTVSLLNRGMGHVASRLSWWVVDTTVQQFRAALSLAPISWQAYRRAVDRIPALYAMSEGVVPPITDAHAITTGFWFLDHPTEPDADLLRFLDEGEPPVYVGFGSMPSRDPARTLAGIGAALERLGRRGVLARGWSGASESGLPSHLHLLDSVDHGWLFPRMAALVHHGGAGTTAAGMRAGTPSLIVPHIADQPYWGRRVAALGVGVDPVPRTRLTVEKLTRRLDQLLSDTTIRTRASALGRKIQAEDGVGNAVRWLEHWINQRGPG